MPDSSPNVHVKSAKNKDILAFEFFKSRCEHWRRVLNLLDWKTFYNFEDLDGEYANVWWDLSGRTSVISLNRTNDLFQEKMTPMELLRNMDMSAFHECLHLLYAWYSTILKDINEKQCTAMDHQIIRVLENSVFDVMVRSEEVNPYMQELKTRKVRGKK